MWDDKVRFDGFQEFVDFGISESMFLPHNKIVDFWVSLVNDLEFVLASMGTLGTTVWAKHTASPFHKGCSVYLLPFDFDYFDISVDRGDGYVVGMQVP